MNFNSNANHGSTINKEFPLNPRQVHIPNCGRFQERHQAISTTRQHIPKTESKQVNVGFE